MMRRAAQVTAGFSALRSAANLVAAAPDDLDEAGSRGAWHSGLGDVLNTAAMVLCIARPQVGGVVLLGVEGIGGGACAHAAWTAAQLGAPPPVVATLPLFYLPSLAVSIFVSKCCRLGPAPHCVPHKLGRADLTAYAEGAAAGFALWTLAPPPPPTDEERLQLLELQREWNEARRGSGAS